MKTTILHEIDRNDLKNIVGEVLDEKLKFLTEPKTSAGQISYLNRFEVKERLRISLPTLNNWSKQGILQSYRIGNRVLYREDEINASLTAVRNLKYRRL
jgi:hypothetical protein